MHLSVRFFITVNSFLALLFLIQQWVFLFKSALWLEILPDDCGTLSKYNSDVCKWHIFVSNITEDAFQLLTETFALDYKWSLCFQTFDASEVVEQMSQPIPASTTDDILKGFLVFCITFSSHAHVLSLHPPLCHKVLMGNWCSQESTHSLPGLELFS